MSVRTPRGFPAPAPPEERPRLLYFSRIDFPNRKANSIQSMNTCHALAGQGWDVLLVVRRLLQSRRDCFAFYGLPDQPRLRFVSLSLPIPGPFNDWQGPYFRFYLASLLRRHRRGSTVLMTRDPAGLELLSVYHALRPHPGLPTVFEVHKLSFLTKASHQEEKGRSLADERVRAKIDNRRRLEEEVYAAVDGLVCTSHGAERLLRQHFAVRAPVCVIPNGVRLAPPSIGAAASAGALSEGGAMRADDARRDREGDAGAASQTRSPGDLDDARRDLEVLYIGQLYRWKGIDCLVRAMAHLPGRRLTVVGGNDPEDVERLRVLAVELGVDARIDFVGYVPPPRVGDYMRRARVGVIPLPHEGYIEAAHFTSPLKAFELMQAGTPIVASDLPSMREILTGGEHALLVDPDDPAALASGIERLLGDRALAAALVGNAARHVQRFGWDERGRRIADYLGGLQSQAQASEA